MEACPCRRAHCAAGLGEPPSAKEPGKRSTGVHMSDEPSDETGQSTGLTEGAAGEKLSLFTMALWGPDGPPEGVLGRDDLCRARRTTGTTTPVGDMSRASDSR